MALFLCPFLWRACGAAFGLAGSPLMPVRQPCTSAASLQAAHHMHQGLVMESTQAGNVLTFPKSKKRGPKVRTGPSAEVVTLPTMDRAVSAIRDASTNVERLMAIMDWAKLKYGKKNLPTADVLARDLRSAGAIP
jgi:hypothetical protein